MHIVSQDTRDTERAPAPAMQTDAEVLATLEHLETWLRERGWDDATAQDAFELRNAASFVSFAHLLLTRVHLRALGLRPDLAAREAALAHCRCWEEHGTGKHVTTCPAARWAQPSQIVGGGR